MPERTKIRADRPEALHAVIEDAFNRGDLDAYLDAYDDDATLVVPPDGRVVHGRDDIRAASVPLFALRPRMTIVVEMALRADGLALTHARWQLDAIAEDGRRTELSGRGTMVSRRGPDGIWRIVLDNPLSPT